MPKCWMKNVVILVASWNFNQKELIFFLHLKVIPSHSFIQNAVMISYNYAEKSKDYVKQLKSMYYFLFYTTSKNIVATVVVFDLKNR